MGLSVLSCGYTGLKSLSTSPQRSQMSSKHITKQGSKDLLRLNPIDARLESTCIQIWGMKQND
jgi:hypothetical protein